MDTKTRWSVVLLAVLFCGTAPAQPRPRAAQNSAAATRGEVDALREQVQALEERLAALERRIADLGQRLGVAAPDNAPANEAAIRQALRDKKLVPGMTFAQVVQVVGKPTELIETSDTGDVYRWTISSNLQVLPNGPKPTELGEYTVIVQFAGGRASSFRRIEHGQRIPRDELRPR